MEAIRAADPDRSEQVMRRHVLGFEQAIRRAL
jgi:DNA-binding FadR family transcriptional regulator